MVNKNDNKKKKYEKKKSILYNFYNIIFNDHYLNWKSIRIKS